MKHIKVRANDELLDRLRAASDITSIPQSIIVRKALVAELDKIDVLIRTIEKISQGSVS